MNCSILGIIGVRLLAIWMIAMGITFLPQLVSLCLFGNLFMAHADNPVVTARWMQFVFTLQVVDRLLVGFLLWVFASWLSRRLVPDCDGSSSKAAVWARGGIGVAGLVIAVRATPPLIYEAIRTPSYVSTIGGLAAGQGVFAIEAWTRLGAQAILVLLGLGLILGARRLYDLIFRPRASAA